MDVHVDKPRTHYPIWWHVNNLRSRSIKITADLCEDAVVEQEITCPIDSTPWIDHTTASQQGFH
jgi:hypothetical protein